MPGPRLRKALLALAAIAAAFTLTVASEGFQASFAGLDIDDSPRARAARGHDPYDLTRLQVLNAVLLKVTNEYVEPERVLPQGMLLAGLNAIQRAVPPVLVDYREGDANVRVQVNDQQQTFGVTDVDSPWKLAERIREVFGFLQQHLDGEADIELREVEYVAINGMLRTLDPHTVLLTPEVFDEMRMSTRGEFGGLGIVISIRDGHLTVIRPMPNTPAARAGLARGDRIVKIDEEATVNMPLSEAVNRLRGAPGSRVSVWTSRKGEGSTWSAPRRVDLVRAVIHIESVEHRMLADRVGYLKINNFQGNTYDDMRRALQDLHRQDLRGLVLDLRDNPGGLLDQAVKVADAFLPSGTIVTTSSRDPSQRDIKTAERRDTEPDYPMVVLINESSASASEIVAGALKNHDRAVVIGQTSFGKGSVQVLYNFHDGSALKLTVAQYLTPGEVSIQGVGIVPDIEIDAMTVDREDMNLAADTSHLREADLQQHLTNASATMTERPSVLLRYYLSSERRRELAEAEPNEVENEEEAEFLTRFSQRLLARARQASRSALLREAAPVIDQAREQELRQAETELRRLGIDWSAGTDRGPTTLQVEVGTDRPNDTVRAGEPFNLRVRVTNTGTSPVYQLHAVTKSDYRLFSDREIVLGKIDPGQTREWTTTLGVCTTENEQRRCRVPRDTLSRADGIKLTFTEAHGHVPAPAEIRTTVLALERPQFAYAVHAADDVQGNGDGRLSRGEHGTMYLRVKNVGHGRTYETQANLRNLSGRGVLLHQGRFRIDDMQPGEERVVRFTFEVLADYERDEAKLEVSVVDLDLRESINERVVLPLASESATVAARTGEVVLPAGAVVRAQPRRDADVVARVATGPLALPSQASLGEFVRVAMSGEAGWVLASDVVTERPARNAALAFELDHMPPRIEVEQVDTLVTRDASFSLRGTATDDQRVLDLYVFADARKVHYLSNQGGDPRRVAFRSQIPLHGGMNYLTIFVRERDDVITRRTLVVRRDAADGALMETPRFDDTLFGGDEGEPDL